MIFAHDLLHKGGDWLGAARAWVQSKKLNGERVTWGSHEELQPPMTVSQVEEVAAYAAAAEINRFIRLVENCKDITEEVKKGFIERIARS